MSETLHHVPRLEALLVKNGAVTIDQLAEAKERQRGAKRPLVEILLEQEIMDEQSLVEALSRALRIPICSASDLQPDAEVQRLVDADTAQRLGVLPLRIEDDVLVVATANPLQIVEFDELTQRTGYRVRPLLARQRDVRQAMRAARKGEEAVHELLKNSAASEAQIVVEPPERESVEPPKKQGEHNIDPGADDGPTIRLVNLILTDSIRQGASDVHIEPEESGMKVRFRIDGELREVLVTPPEIHSSVAARIKIMASMDIFETRVPQDGRARIRWDDRPYDLRISTLPAYFGEKCVVRILDPASASFDLDRSGISPTTLSKWRELTRRPNGLLLMTGPTGSGKTSTLLASLLEIRDPALNIVTIEDPVEFRFPGIVHVPVRSDVGMTFSAALRSILRQDPDVILVGEIRDPETAKIALQAAMTGHLVLSTLHTNDAVGAIARLLDLGADPSLVSSCLLGVMAQRLVRTNCSHCREPFDYGVESLAKLGWDPSSSHPIDTQRGAGCAECRGSGQRGRAAIAELVVMTPALSALLEGGATAGELKQQARAEGTQLLVESALDRVLVGDCAPGEAALVVADEVAAQSRPSNEDLTTDQSVPVLAPTVLCGGCGHDLLESFRFCPTCGAERIEEPEGPTLLIVDDDPSCRKIVELALRSDFPRRHNACDGDEALDAVARVEPDLLVIDQEMPGRSGVEVIRILRSQLATVSLPIIMLTGSLDDMMESLSLDAGADDYLRKPVSAARLRARARALLRSRSRITASLSSPNGNDGS